MVKLTKKFFRDMGQKGGLKGGKSGAAVTNAKLTSKQRSTAATKAWITKRKKAKKSLPK